MDIATQAEIILRNAGYETWTWTGMTPTFTCFENPTLMGFIHIFETAEALMTTWTANQQIALTRHAPAIRSSGVKAWNVYSVFLTSDPSPMQNRDFERIEEDFSLTRKIARTAIQIPDDVERALLPLIAVTAKPLLGASNFETRLRSRLKDIAPDAVTAFLSDTSAIEVARILGETS